MTIALRCYHCQEWVYRPESGREVCPCRKLFVHYDGKVRGFYSEFWNEDKNLHFVYETPRGGEA
jgi:hypothetical protein